MKPFKPPTVVRTVQSKSTPSVEPPAKRRRLSEKHEDTDSDVDATVATAKILQSQTKSPAHFRPPSSTRKVLDDLTNSSSQSQQNDAGSEEYYTVLWRKFTTKKHKTWDGDGVLAVVNGYATLQSDSGNTLGRTACKIPLLPGSQLSIAGKEVEVEALIPKKVYLAGRVFLGNVDPGSAAQTKKTHPATNQLSNDGPKHKKLVLSQKRNTTPLVSSSPASYTAFKTPLLNSTQRTQTGNVTKPLSRHDAHAPGALVMKRPASVPKGKQIVDVVVDPLLSKKLREHQRVGVSFLYECVMGMKGYAGEGAILADEMGVGKTLQTIALLWTLLKQNPVYGDGPVVKKALIVCPVSLISNWRKEIYKWLGGDRIGVLIAGENKYTRLEDFSRGKTYSIMIIGYEKLRLVQDDLQKGANIDIVIADEGHRLKTAQNKSAQAIKSLNTERRIILSGTPLQNDMMEFYTMVDFVNPGLLNKYSTFKRQFEMPILKSRQPEASAMDIEKGEARSQELADLTGMFILRRTADILSKYLPSKTEYVVFCRPTQAQAAMYRSITASPIFSAALGSTAVSLELITILKKVCNSPDLLRGNLDAIDQMELAEVIPRSLLGSSASSGKIQVLRALLNQIRTTTDEKVVLVSNYTSTLDILAHILDSRSYSYLRLDGSTPANKRQELVDRFNRSSQNNAFVFLLSAKAGGLGLNLIGASRLVLFDLDWNPATDLQAMARVHRDGQKRPCYIYRLVTQGAIEEKIFQRQVSKIGLADSIVDGKTGVSGFTREELRDIFTLDEGEGCQTHRLLSCACDGTGIAMATSEEVGDDDDDEAPRNDLAELSRGPDMHNDASVEVLRLDVDDEIPRRPPSQWKTANEYGKESEENDVRPLSTEKAKMLSLMQYTHFDTGLVAQASPDQTSSLETREAFESATGLADPDPVEVAIEDAALRSVLQEDVKRIGFVFTKLSI